MDCQHRTLSPIASKGKAEIFGCDHLAATTDGKTTAVNCRACPFRPNAKRNPEARKPITHNPDWDISQPSRGLGDTAAKLFHAIGIRKRRGCGCSKRQALLNRLVPYK